MLTVLTVLTAFIAIVLTVAHWRTVREMLLWINAGITIIALLVGLVTLLVALCLFVWSAIKSDSGLAMLSGLLAAIAVALFLVCGFSYGIERWDRDRQFARFRSYWERPQQAKPTKRTEETE